jgi:hypothetical protein
MGDRGIGDEKRLSKGSVKKDTLPPSYKQATRQNEEPRKAPTPSTADRRASAMDALAVGGELVPEVDEGVRYRLSLSLSPLVSARCRPSPSLTRGGDVPKTGRVDKRQKPTGGMQRWARTADGEKCRGGGAEVVEQ